jgi:hypothetical protein
MLTFLEHRQVLTEWLSASQKAKVNKWEKGDNSHTDHIFGGPDTDKKTHQRRYYEYGGETLEDKIHTHIKAHGYHVHDYEKGLAVDKHGRETRIGKVLHKTNAPDELKKSYEQDNRELTAKASKERGQYSILFSRHPHDVAGMTSKDCPWHSCMEFGKGSNRHYLEGDIKHGTHIAYLVHKDDTNGEPKRPLARIAIKRFTDKAGNHILVPEPRNKGDAPTDFRKSVEGIVDAHNKNQPLGKYHRPTGTYNDGSGYSQLHIPNGDIDAAVHHSDWEVKAAAAKHPHLSQDHITHLVAGSGAHEPDTLDIQKAKEQTRDALVDRKDISSNHLAALFDHSSSDTQRGKIVGHPKADGELLSKAWHTPDQDFGVLSKIVHHPNTPDHIVSAGLTHERQAVRHKALINPKVTADQLHTGLSKAIEDNDAHGAQLVLSHPKHDASHVTKTLNHTFNPYGSGHHDVEGTLRQAIKSPHASSDHITTYLGKFDSKRHNSWGSKFHSDLIDHPHLNSEHIDAILNQSDDIHVKTSLLNRDDLQPHHIDRLMADGGSLAGHAARHKSAQPHHIERALSHSDPAVRQIVAKSAPLSDEQFEKVATDKVSEVRRAALARPDLPEKHLTTLIKHAHKGFKAENSSYETNRLMGDLVQHKGLTPEHITQLAKNKHLGYVNVGDVFQHPSFKPRHVGMILRHPDPDVAKRVFQGDAYSSRDVPHVNSKHVDIALEHPDGSVRAHALTSKHATLDHLKKGIHDTDPMAKRAAIDHLRRKNYLVLEKRR